MGLGRAFRAQGQKSLEKFQAASFKAFWKVQGGVEGVLHENLGKGFPQILAHQGFQRLSSRPPALSALFRMVFGKEKRGAGNFRQEPYLFSRRNISGTH